MGRNEGSGSFLINVHVADNGNNTGIYIVGGGIAAFVLYKYVIKPNVIVPAQTKNFIQRLRVQLKNPKINNDNVSFDVLIQNPNSAKINVKAIVGEVNVLSAGKSYHLGNVAQYGDSVIQPTQESRYPFTIRLKLIPLIAYFSDIVKGKVKGQTLLFTGTINIDGRPWPVKEGLKIA